MLTQPENPMPMRPYRLVFSTLDRNSNEVRLTESQWRRHILIRHSEMEPYLEEIRATIENPQMIVADRSDDEAHFWAFGAVANRPHQYLKVVVVYSNEGTGRRIGSVRTAFFTERRPKGGIIYEREPNSG